MVLIILVFESVSASHDVTCLVCHLVLWLCPIIIRNLSNLLSHVCIYSEQKWMEGFSVGNGKASVVLG